MVKEALADDTRGALPHALRVGVRPEHVAHNGHQQLSLRANHLVDHDIQRPGGLHHLARDQLSVPGRPALSEEAEEMGTNKARNRSSTVAPTLTPKSSGGGSAQ